MEADKQFPQHMALSEQLMAHVGAFKAEATDLVKTIIDEMTQEKQTYQPTYRI
jgi:hypothetical protein